MQPLRSSTGPPRALAPSRRRLFRRLRESAELPAQEEFTRALFERPDSGSLEVAARLDEAYRRLFAKFGLDYDVSSESEQIEALCEMKKAVPHEWVRFIESKTGRAKQLAASAAN